MPYEGRGRTTAPLPELAVSRQKQNLCDRRNVSCQLLEWNQWGIKSQTISRVKGDWDWSHMKLKFVVGTLLWLTRTWQPEGSGLVEWLKNGWWLQLHVDGETERVNSVYFTKAVEKTRGLFASNPRPCGKLLLTRNTIINNMLSTLTDDTVTFRNHVTMAGRHH